MKWRRKSTQSQRAFPARSETTQISKNNELGSKRVMKGGKCLLARWSLLSSDKIRQPNRLL